MKKERWGKKYGDKRNWRAYNEELVARREACISLDFIQGWDSDLIFFLFCGSAIIGDSAIPFRTSLPEIAANSEVRHRHHKERYPRKHDEGNPFTHSLPFSVDIAPKVGC